MKEYLRNDLLARKCLLKEKSYRDKFVYEIKCIIANGLKVVKSNDSEGVVLECDNFEEIIRNAINCSCCCSMMNMGSEHHNITTTQPYKPH